MGMILSIFQLSFEIIDVQISDDVRFCDVGSLTISKILPSSVLLNFVRYSGSNCMLIVCVPRNVFL